MEGLYSEIRIMRGPNMWSTQHHQLIAVKFNSDAIPETSAAEKENIRNYFSEHYQIAVPDEEINTSVFKMVLSLAAKIQDADFYHEILFPTPGIPYGVVQYEVEEAGTEAVEAASQMVTSLLNGEEPFSFQTVVQRVKKTADEHNNGPSTSLIISAARKRDIPVSKGPAGYTLLGYGKKQKKISAAISHHTSCIGVNIAGNKQHTKEFLINAQIPVPHGEVIQEENDLMEIAAELGYPLVTKPLHGNQGKNITCDVKSFENLLTGFRYAKEASDSVVIEKEIKGHDFRLLVIGNQFIAASMRLPAHITGDGQQTIAELVEKENTDPTRGVGHENILTKIELDAASELCLQKQGFTTTCIPPNEQRVYLKLTANLSTGGTAEDVTDLVHPSNKALAEKVSRVLGLDICGIDVMAPNLSQPLAENGGAVIEVNAAPGLRMHQYPSKGNPREVGKPIVDLMFEDGENGRIPIIAITGTNGKTTTTRLMAHVLTFVGQTVGFSSTDGIYIGSEKVQTGDCSGPQSAQTILQDTTVEAAVLECARGGIIRSGLGFDACDIAIVTNVAADHLGMKDIYSVEDLAKVKVVVPQAVKKDGWAILNAGNELTYAMKDQVKCNVALFSLEENNQHFQQHLDNGGTGIYADEKLDIYIQNPSERLYIFNAAEVPITRGGRAGFMIENVLPVVLASYLYGLSKEQIAEALKSFVPTAEHTPGRINEFKINGVNVILDYAHNPHGLRALSNYIKNIPGKKLGIITGTGDRREEDIIEFGRIAAGMYDEIIIRFDRDLRGRTTESIVELLERGMFEVNPTQEYTIIPDTKTAIYTAVSNAEKDSHVVICADNATYTLGLTREVAAQFF